MNPQKNGSISFNYIKPPQFSDDPVVGQGFVADVAIRGNLNIEFIISEVEIVQSIDLLLHLLTITNKLSPGELSTPLSPFISIDGDPEDLGVWIRVYRQKKPQSDFLDIQISSRIRSPIQIQCRSSDLDITIKNFFRSTLQFVQKISISNDFIHELKKKLSQILS